MTKTFNSAAMIFHSNRKRHLVVKREPAHYIEREKLCIKRERKFFSKGRISVCPLKRLRAKIESTNYTSQKIVIVT